MEKIPENPEYEALIAVWYEEMLRKFGEKYSDENQERCMSNSGRIGGKKHTTTNKMLTPKAQIDGVGGGVNRSHRRAYAAMARKNQDILTDQIFPSLFQLFFLLNLNIQQA